MHFVEVLEGCRQPCQHRLRVNQIDAADIVAPDDVDEALGQAVALWAAHGHVDRLQAQQPGHAPGVLGNVGAAVAGESFQRVLWRHRLHGAEAPLHHLDPHFAHWRARQTRTLPGAPAPWMA